jgi:peptide/nickel transport system ATP-binding protein
MSAENTRVNNSSNPTGSTDVSNAASIQAALSLAADFASGPPKTPPVLEGIHLRKHFPLRQFGGSATSNVVHAVEDATLALYPGRALALVGESGSGKSTIARMLARLYSLTSGILQFEGKPVTGDGRAALREYRRHVQMIFQDPFSSLNPVHNVRYHLSRPLRLYSHVQSKRQETDKILTLLDRVSLSPAEQFIQKYPHQLSGGQRQRVAIAQALAVRPKVILADEPVSMLDVSIRLDILNLMLALKDEERLAFLFITHDIASARYFAEETMIMYAGQVMEGGPSDAVIQQPKHPYTQLLISAAPDPDRPEEAPFQAHGDIPSLITPPTGCRFHPRCPHAMPVCHERFPRRTNLGNGHWTHCFLYGEGNDDIAPAPPSTSTSANHA